MQSKPIQTALSRLDPIWAAAIAAIFPELVLKQRTHARHGMPATPWQQHLFEACARAILGTGQPLILLIDDMQWCDQATLEWLHYLLRYDAHARLLVVGTARSEEIMPDHRLAAFLAVLHSQNQATEIELGPLNARETALLAKQLAGYARSPADEAALYRETEGNPLCIVEAVHADCNGQLPHTCGLTCTAAQQSRFQAVVAARLARLSPAAAELAGLAAIIGRTFSFELIAHASTMDEATLVGSLEELWQRRIIRERNNHIYEFSHGQLRRAAEQQLSATRRQFWHRRLAQESLTLEEPEAARHVVLATSRGEIA